MWTASTDCWTMSILLVLSDFKLSSQVLLETGVVYLNIKTREGETGRY